MKKHRILIVDDQKEVSKVLRASLETINASFDIIDCLSGEEAMVVPKNSELDLLIADIGLPGMSGFKLMEWFRSINPEVKVILISGETDPKIRSQVAAAGADAFFFKPIDIPEFLDITERCLNIIASILPTEMDLERIEVEKEESGVYSISEEGAPPATSDLMNFLYKKLSAHVVLLAGDDGKILVRIGSFPLGVEEEEIVPLVTETFLNSIKVIDSLRGKKNHSFFSCSNVNMGLIMEPIGEAYYLLVITKPFNSTSLGLISKETNKTSDLISTHLVKMGISTQDRDVKGELGVVKSLEVDQMEVNSKNVQPEDPALNKILINLDQLLPDDAESYWGENPIEINAGNQSFPKTLTYDEAKEMGVLLPENNFPDDEETTK
jgi:DNA-binding response OmpR family regulator